MVTLDDVAARAGVSRMTASNALRGKTIVRPETAERVLRAASELSYRPNLAARQLSSGQSHTLGFSTVELDNSPFSAALAAAISDYALSRGYQTLIQQTRYSAHYEQSMFSSPSSQLTDGMIISAPSLDAHTLEKASKHSPLVIFDSAQPLTQPLTDSLEGNLDIVLSPCESGAHVAVTHLLDQGARRILCLGTDPHSSDNDLSGSGARMRGVKKAYADHGLTWDSTLESPCAWTMNAGYDAMTRILDARDSSTTTSFDALFCLTDVVALGALRALREHSIRVPDDILVASFDGLTASMFASPSLTTIHVDTRGIAHTCVDFLLERIHGQASAPRIHEADFSLVIRESSSRS